MSTSGSRAHSHIDHCCESTEGSGHLSEEGGVTFSLHQTSPFPNAMVPLCWHRHPHTKYMVLIRCLVMASLLVFQLAWFCVALSCVHCFLAQSLPWTLYRIDSWIIINPFLLKHVHFLVGVNSDGHSTLANYWQNRDQNPSLCASNSSVLTESLPLLCSSKKDELKAPCSILRIHSWKKMFAFHTHLLVCFFLSGLNCCSETRCNESWEGRTL